jgi:hypothetical protein
VSNLRLPIEIAYTRIARPGAQHAFSPDFALLIEQAPHFSLKIDQEVLYMICVTLVSAPPAFFADIA